MVKNSFTSLIKGKETFLMKVYGILLFQLIITFAIVYSFRQHPLLSRVTNQSIWLYAFITIGILLIMIFIQMPTWLKFIFFCLLTAFIGAMLHSLSAVMPVEVINQALIGAITVFITMTVIALILSYQGIDISWMGMYLLAALVGLIIASIIALFVNSEAHSGFHKALLIIGLILFSIFVIYDTNVILNKNYQGDSLQAALDFYLSFINIFTHILALDVS
jgi:FtsH-binding integral membrane protein